MITVCSPVKHKKILKAWSENKKNIFFHYQYVLPYGNYDDSKNKGEKITLKPQLNM